MRQIIILADGRDFHAIDWFHTISKVCNEKSVIFLTDILSAEGRLSLLKETDYVIEMHNIDKWLFDTKSSYGDLWRNFVKLLSIPFQVFFLKKIAKKFPDAHFHAHSMYYIFLSWLSGIRSIGSPQGSEILIRPFQSKLYHFFARKSLQSAKLIVVDSEQLRRGIKKIANRDSVVVQYGVDVDGIMNERKFNCKRNGILSIRGWYPLYRIADIISERNIHLPNVPLKFIYPFYEYQYSKKILALVKSFDIVNGRLPFKKNVYELLSRTQLVISIPQSDSSPRSVYESIFSGCAVAVTNNDWVNILPDCMKKRIIIVDLEKPNWLYYAIEESKKIIATNYFPTKEALDLFDQERSMVCFAKKYYK